MGLDAVFRGISVLHSERNAPELPIPVSSIEAYATRYGLSGVFVGLVRRYDEQVISKRNEQMRERRKKK